MREAREALLAAFAREGACRASGRRDRAHVVPEILRRAVPRAAVPELVSPRPCWNTRSIYLSVPGAILVRKVRCGRRLFGKRIPILYQSLGRARRTSGALQQRAPGSRFFVEMKPGTKWRWYCRPIGTVLNLRTTTSQKCEAVPRRARI